LTFLRVTEVGLGHYRPAASASAPREPRIDAAVAKFDVEASGHLRCRRVVDARWMQDGAGNAGRTATSRMHGAFSICQQIGTPRGFDKLRLDRQRGRAPSEPQAPGGPARVGRLVCHRRTPNPPLDAGGGGGWIGAPPSTPQPYIPPFSPPARRGQPRPGRFGRTLRPVGQPVGECAAAR
jgi:hypothetical protein